MITILSSDCYRGLSAPFATAQHGAQPGFIGRIQWPGSEMPEEAYVKLYETDTCGTANEAIGYAVNTARGIEQPKRGAVLLLTRQQLPQWELDWSKFLDEGYAICWVTSLEQETRPFRFIRKQSSFSDKQLTAFYTSPFCLKLATVDHVTGNNDRHEGNFLYKDDLQYMAIDQGCIGGGLHWHKMGPDNLALNQLVRLARENLKASQWGKWSTDALMTYESSQAAWRLILPKLANALFALLTKDEIVMITAYMETRASDPAFAKSCEKLI